MEVCASHTDTVRCPLGRAATIPAVCKWQGDLGGLFHIDIAEVQTGEVFLFVGIDRTSQFAITQLISKVDSMTA